MGDIWIQLNQIQQKEVEVIRCGIKNITFCQTQIILCLLFLVDTAATDTNQNAQFDSGIAENTGNVARPLGYAGGTADAADGSRRTDGADTDSVSGDTSSTGGTDSDGDLNLDGNLPITGWESERELLTATLYGGTDGETPLEADGFSLTYPDDLSDNLGIDSAYLAADVMNIIDNDSHTEDCTTMNQLPNNMKNTQSGGYNMSM